MKGFKILEASYEESKRKLAAVEDELSNVTFAKEALFADVGVARQLLRERETVRQSL